jgi:hypothetical protein
MPFGPRECFILPLSRRFVRLAAHLHSRASIVSPAAPKPASRFSQLDRRKRVQELVLNIVRKPSLVGGAIHHFAHDFPGLFQ